MKKCFELYCMLLLFAVLAHPNATAAVQDDRAVVVRSFDPEKLNQLKNDGQFDYRSIYREKSVSIFEKIWKLINQYLDWIFRKVFNMNTPAIAQWIFFIAVAVFGGWVIIRLLDINIRDSFLKPSDSGNLNFKVEEENIHELDFDRLIAESMERSEYRIAVRYLYLFALKKLSDRNLIEWVPGKTNLEYERELKEKPLSVCFARLGYYFEYAWYGDFQITSDGFNKARGIFENLNGMLVK